MFINLWWAQEIEIPEVNKIIVFNNGIVKGSKALIPIGGHFIPNSIIWVSLIWKNLQKNEIKKNTSEIINKIIPIFIFKNTFLECKPWKVLSRVISRHHWNIINNVIIIAKKLIEEFFVWNNLIVLINNIIVLSDPNKGHGL